MGGVERQESPGATVLVEGPEDAEFLRRLFAHSDARFKFVHVLGALQLDRRLRELRAGSELVIVFVDGPRPAEEIVAAIVALSGTPSPTLLLTTDREVAAEWPAALQNLPVIFADGDPQAIAVRLRLTIQLLVSDYEKKLAAQARQAGRAQSSVQGSKAASSQPAQRRDESPAKQLAVTDLLVEDAESRHRHRVTQAREDLGSFLEQQLDALLVEHLEDRALTPGQRPDSVESASPDRGWDVAIWADALGSPSMNPVLVKYSHDLDQKGELRESLSDLGLFVGIFVHDDGQPQWEVFGNAVVVSIGIHQLADYSKRRFHKLMVESRDRLVHSRP